MYDKNAIVTMMLCSKLCVCEDYPPLNATEWSNLASTLSHNGICPSDLPDMTVDTCMKILRFTREDAERIYNLIQVGNDTLYQIEQLQTHGIYTVTKSDNEFPQLLKRKLGEYCPPVLYFTGNIALANKNSVAISGSRNPSKTDIELATMLTQRIINSNHVITTGGGSGIELDIERFAYENNGYVVQFCAGDMYSKMSLPIYKQQLARGHLLMISKVGPKDAFTLENARERNKYMYANAEAAYVIKADKGHVTYHGAADALEWKLCEVFCWNNPHYLGNIDLISMGAHPIKATVRENSSGEQYDRFKE